MLGNANWMNYTSICEQITLLIEEILFLFCIHTPYGILSSITPTHGVPT